MFSSMDDPGRSVSRIRGGKFDVPLFRDQSIEIDIEGRENDEELEEAVMSDSPRRSLKSSIGQTDAKPKSRPTFTATHIWVRGPQLPVEVVEDGLLTPEDHRDLTLDHIARTSELVAQVQITKWA